MSQFPHYWFYPIAYVYGGSINKVKMNKEPFSLSSKAYALYVSDTSFCDINKSCDIGEGEA